MRRVRAILVGLGAAVLGLAACAPPSLGARHQEAEARRLLAAADSAEAYRIVQEAVREHPDDAELRRLQLQLRHRGFGTDIMTLDARAGHTAEAARELLRLVPDDTLALRTLVDDALQTAARWHDRVDLTDINPMGLEFVTEEEIRARRALSGFDIAQRQFLAPTLDHSHFARRAHERAIGHIATWLALDPAAKRPHEAAVTLAALTHNWNGVLQLAQRMRAMTDSPHADLYVGLAHYRLGDVEAAGGAFERAMGRLPAREQAHYDDIWSLLPLDQREAHDAAPDSVRAAFWAEADPRLLTELNERRVEHVARVVEADLLLGARPLGLFRPNGPRGSETSEGQIWIRYGRPRTHSWRLDGPGARAFRVWDYDGFRFVFDDMEFDGEFTLFTWGQEKDDYVLQDRDMQRSDPSRTQYGPERTLEVSALASRFRAPNGGMDVVVGFGTPVEMIEAPVKAGAFARLGTAVVGRDEREHGRLAESRLASASGYTFWTEAAEVTLPGAGEVVVEIEAYRGNARGRETLDVAPLDLPADGLGVSDVLLALLADFDGDGPVVRGGVGLVPAPTATFRTSEPLYLYLEAYGLAVGENGETRYEVEAELLPEGRSGILGRVLGRGERRGVSIQFEGAGTAPDEPISFIVETGDQDPGRYTLTIRVTDALTGQAASTERDLELE